MSNYSFEVTLVATKQGSHISNSIVRKQLKKKKYMPRWKSYN